MDLADPGEGTAPPSGGLALARKVLAWALLAELVVLAATGAYLHQSYRPTAAQSWNEIYDGVEHLGRVMWVRRAHRTTSLLALPTVLALLVVAAIERRVRLWVVVAGCILLDVLAASVTGSLLPWDQLGLRRIQVGTNVSGYGDLFSDRIRFAIIGGSEVPASTVRAWLVVHVVLGILAIAGVALLLAPRARLATSTRSATAAADAADDAADDAPAAGAPT